MEFWAGFPILVGESFGQKKNNAIFHRHGLQAI